MLMALVAFGQSKKLKRIEYPGLVTFVDDRGNVVETQTVDDKGNLINNELGFAVTKCKFDKRGNRLRQSYYDQNGKLSVDNLGVAIWKYKYDSNNNKIYQGHFGLNGKLRSPNESILHSEWFWKYDKEGKLLSVKGKNK